VTGGDIFISYRVETYAYPTLRKALAGQYWANRKDELKKIQVKGIAAWSAFGCIVFSGIACF
jgi:hypothetical protein